MSAKKITPEEAGLPQFQLKSSSQKEQPGVDKSETLEAESSRWGQLFNLSSHERARQAIEFGLNVREIGYNIFVIGEDRSGRMSATLDFLETYTKELQKPSDWVYVNNFKYAHRPKPFALPNEQGQAFRDHMKKMVQDIKQTIITLFESEEYEGRVHALTHTLEEQIRTEIETIRQFSNTYGLDLQRGNDGNIMIVLAKEGADNDPNALSEKERKKLEEGMLLVREKLNVLTQFAKEEGNKLSSRLNEIRLELADEKISPFLDALEKRFSGIPGLGRWFVELRADMLEHIPYFLEVAAQEAGDEEGESTLPFSHSVEDRYSVNLIVDHSEHLGYPIIVEPTPTYENIFGAIKYRATSAGYETNFMQIQAGSLHRANGGILIIRANAIAQYSQVWDALKAALRDQEIRIEEMHRAHGIPMLQAPDPYPIPLNVKIVLVGAPRWYSTFFFSDPDFQSHFKVKAEIDPDLPRDDKNLAIYASMIQKASNFIANKTCEDDATTYLMGYASRWAGQRNKLTARFELIEDLIAESGTLAHLEHSKVIKREHVQKAIKERHTRNARLEDAHQEDIQGGHILIDTEGAVVGQINALTVLQVGGYSFGMPSRVTARTYAGDHGIINIERMVDMGGPIQQKGVMELEGFLNGTFAQSFPLSFGCSITFEQNYGGVEGDSASMAELCAVLSSLSNIPIRQDIGITGSVNQMGRSQAIGGINEKIEGFFRTCLERGLTGTQGVILPKANVNNLSLNEEVVAAIRQKKFHLWSVEDVHGALEILTNTPAGHIHEVPGTQSVFRQAYEKLESYDHILTTRERLAFGGGSKARTAAQI